MPDLEKLNILILPVMVPYPLTDGGKICVFSFVDYLRFTHRFTIIIPLYNEEQLQHFNELVEIWPNVNVIGVTLFTSSILPKTSKPKKSFFEKICWHMVAFIQSRFLKPNVQVDVETKQSHTEKNLLDEASYSFPFIPYPKQYIDFLENHFANHRHDIIHVSLTRNLNLIQILPKDSKRVFEQIESRFDVLKDYTFANNMTKLYSEYVVKNFEFMENCYLEKYDAVFTLNENDKAYLQTAIPGLEVYCSPFGVLNKDIKPLAKAVVKPSKIIFSGNESHYPNYDALVWYLENVHQLVTDKIETDLFITGLWQEETVTLFTSKYNNINFVQLVDNYPAFLEGSVVIAPIRIGGGGLRTKILYAMGNCIPVVSTSLGAHGITAVNERDILIADDHFSFCDNILKLLKNELLYETIAKNAHKLVRESYSQTYTANLRNTFYKKLVFG